MGGYNDFIMCDSGYLWGGDGAPAIRLIRSSALSADLQSDFTPGGVGRSGGVTPWLIYEDCWYLAAPHGFPFPATVVSQDSKFVWADFKPGAPPPNPRNAARGWTFYQ